MSRDFYKILGIERGVSQDEIKKAYRKLAHQHHPDKQGGNEAKFKEINEAYQVLSDPQKKSQYDQFGSDFSGFNGGASGGFNGFQGFGGFSDQGGFSNFGQGFDMEDIFDMFGGAFGRSSGRSSEDLSGGSDLQMDLGISFYNSARGAIKEVEISKESICDDCDGSGALDGKSSELENCRECNGSGQIRRSARSIFGTINRVSVCENCRGIGRIPKNKCKICGGDGRKKTRKILEVKIPGGIKDGQVLIVRNAGQAGFRGGKAGDLYIRISVEKDKRFKREGDDLIYNLQIKLTEALLGSKIKIPTLDGEKELEIPVGIQDGEEIKFKGSGIHSSRKGDQINKIKIQIPKKLSGKAKDLVEELARTGDY